MRNSPPAWLKQSITSLSSIQRMNSLLDELQLHTVCQAAGCPNLGECFAQGTATFLILGNVCTRNCTFCGIAQGYPGTPDKDEPDRIAEAVGRLGLRFVVVTSVTRDDLPDGGAAHFAQTVRLIHSRSSGIKVEVLIPDFGGSPQALQVVLSALPEVVAHNMETVPRLYSAVRPKADYPQSLNLLRRSKSWQPDIVTKSGMMLGLGETGDEVLEVMRNLREAESDILTLGQYLSPSAKQRRVVRYVHPEEFDHYAQVARQMGFRAVASGPWVRSSFQAAKMYSQAIHS